MKKIMYFILLAAELFVGTLFMISLWDSSLYIPIAISVVSLIALLTWQIIMFVKATDISAKKKIKIRIALFMLTPIAVFMATYVIVGIAFVVAFALEGF